MAKKADNKPAATERVTFTSGAADRIAKAVRTVEAGDRDCGPLTFGARGVGGVSGQKFRICTYTGSWGVGSSKIVSFKYQTATPNTVAASNLFFPIADPDTTTARDCAIAKEGTAWFLINVKCAETDIVVDAALTTAGLQFTKARVAVASFVTLSPTFISTTAC